jgi:hypothetical protein
MRTFLTTSKMDPALVERIEASVRGQRAGTARRRASSGRRLVAVARLLFVVVAVASVYALVASKREAKRSLEAARSALLDSVQAHAASLSPEDHGAVARVEPWVARLSGAYEGDLVAAELLPPGAFGAALARPVMYLRGAEGLLGTSAEVAAAATASGKDALVLCLLEPPESRTEKALIDKVRVVYSGGWNLESRTANVRRMNDAVAGLPLLAPEWADKVRRAESAGEIATLRRELERTPVDRAKEAVRAELLLLAVDEPGDGKGPTELDGERRHPVRVALVDLRAEKVLLRVRHDVDPSWITPARRATYASGIDSCALALDVHEDVRKAAGEAAAPKK